MRTAREPVSRSTVIDPKKESPRPRGPQQHMTKRIKMSKLDLRTVRQESVQPEPTARDETNRGITGNVTPILSERPLKGAQNLNGMHTKSKPSF